MPQKKSVIRARKQPVGSDENTEPFAGSSLEMAFKPAEPPAPAPTLESPPIRDLSPVRLKTYKADNVQGMPGDNGIRHLIGERAPLQGRDGWKAVGQGYAVYGPYDSSLPKGKKYRARFHLAIGHLPSAYTRVATLDINDFDPMDPKDHGDILSRRDLYAQEFQGAETWQAFDLDFEGLQRVLETRVFIQSHIEVYIEKVELFELPSGGQVVNDVINHEAESPEMAHEFGRLQRVGSTHCWNANILQDNTPLFGSKSKAGKRMVHGPGDALPKGVYRVSFYVALLDHRNDAAQVLVLRVVDTVPGKLLAQRGVLRTDFQKTRTYQPFDLDFSVLEEGARIDYEVIWSGVAEINLDRIEISTLADPLPEAPAPELTVLGGKIFYGNSPIQLLGVSSYGWLGANSGEDYRHFLDTLAAHHINFTRVFAIFPWANDLYPFSKRTDHKFNLPESQADESENNYNALYFQRLKDFIGYAEQKRIIVQVVLFDEVGMSGSDKPRAWDRHPYKGRNNTRGQVSDPDKGIPAFYEDPQMRKLEEPYIRYLVKSTRNYGNILYEVANEYSGPPEWHRWVAEKIKEQIREDRKLGGRYRLVAANVCRSSIQELYGDKNVDVLRFSGRIWCGAGSPGEGVTQTLQRFPGKPAIFSTDGLRGRPALETELPWTVAPSLPDQIYAWAKEIIQQGGHLEFLDPQIQMPTHNPIIRPRSQNVNLSILQKLSEVNLPPETPPPPPSVSLFLLSRIQPILEDPLTHKGTLGRRQGGEFTSEGFKVTSPLHHFILYQTNLSGQIRVEFEAKGFLPNEATDSKLVFFRMFDSPPDEQEGSLPMMARYFLYEIRKQGLEGGRVGKATNGLALKLGGRGLQNFTRLGTWEPGQARTGNLSWDPDKKYFFRIIWDQRRTKIYRDDVLIYDIYEPRFAPTKIYIRLGGTCGDRKAPIGVTYSNVRIYDGGS